MTDLEKCQLGLNFESSDTDSDGMSDSFEVEFNLAPLNDDASIDLDGDGLTNLEEFLRGSEPNDPASPSNVFFISKNGLDVPAGGSEAATWATIGFALDQVQASVANPVRINVFEGTHTENIALISGVTLAAVLDNIVVIEGTVLARTTAR